VFHADLSVLQAVFDADLCFMWTCLYCRLCFMLTWRLSTACVGIHGCHSSQSPVTSEFCSFLSTLFDRLKLDTLQCQLCWCAGTASAVAVWTVNVFEILNVCWCDILPRYCANLLHFHSSSMHKHLAGAAIAGDEGDVPNIPTIDDVLNAPPLPRQKYSLKVYDLMRIPDFWS